MAKVCAVYEVQQERDRRHDGFIADVTAALYNKMRTQESDKVWTAEDLILSRYPKRKAQGVIITSDPDYGAQGDWRGLKATLKAKTEASKERKKKLKPYAPHP